MDWISFCFFVKHSKVGHVKCVWLFCLIKISRTTSSVSDGNLPKIGWISVRECRDCRTLRATTDFQCFFFNSLVFPFFPTGYFALCFKNCENCSGRTRRQRRRHCWKEEFRLTQHCHWYARSGPVWKTEVNDGKSTELWWDFSTCALLIYPFVWSTKAKCWISLEKDVSILFQWVWTWFAGEMVWMNFQWMFCPMRIMIDDSFCQAPEMEGGKKDSIHSAMTNRLVVEFLHQIRGSNGGFS